MKLFGWLKHRPSIPPEARWRVHIERGQVVIADPDGQTRTIAVATLSAVTVETNDSGPWGIDFWWLLFGDLDGEPFCFPMGATGEDVVVERLTTLNGLDFEAMGRAMQSTQNALFSVWRAPTS